MEKTALWPSGDMMQLSIQVLHVYQRRKRSACGLFPPKHKQDREELEQMEMLPDLSEVEALCLTQWNTEQAWQPGLLFKIGRGLHL